MDKNITVPFTREEISWLYSWVDGAAKKARQIIADLTGPVNVRTDEQEQMLAQAQKVHEPLTALATAALATLEDGDRKRHALADFRRELEEARAFVEEESAKEEIDKRLAQLPEFEPYRVVFEGRESLKFVLQAVEQQIVHYRTHVLPYYEGRKADTYTDPIMTKSYYVNKKKAEKLALEGLNTKLLAAITGKAIQEKKNEAK